jgi:hypothetical protein
MEFAAVESVLNRYFDGLYHSDTTILSTVFHEKAIYACATQAPLVYLTMDQYFPIIDKRPSPASQGESRKDKIISIRFAGPSTAFAEVNCAIGPKYFTDYLTLVKDDGEWRIISKVFHYDLV